jgi:hypothetical protein
MMRALISALLIVFSLASGAVAAELSEISWSTQQIEELKASNKPAVANFLTGINGNFSGHGDCSCVKEEDIGDFGWFDLYGDGKLELVATVDVNGRSFFNALMIYRQEKQGTVNFQEIRGWNIGSLSKVVRDLNGDGKKEFVVPSPLPPGNWVPTSDTVVWPVVYRAEDARYVEASAQFPQFYEKEVLPQLDDKIKKAEAQNYSSSRRAEPPADLVLERDQILRMLGRDPTAGLEQAREWAGSSDPLLIRDAVAVFRDIGGHEDEARAAQSAWKRAYCAQNPGTAMCKDLTS